MNLRHTAALALSVGWYLMLPPTPTWTALVLETNKPLSKWDQNQSFDTAEQCKAAQHKIKNFLVGELSKKREEASSQQSYLSDPVVQTLFGVQARMAASRCIATDDPRLGGK